MLLPLVKHAYAENNFFILFNCQGINYIMKILKKKVWGCDYIDYTLNYL